MYATQLRDDGERFPLSGRRRRGFVGGGEHGGRDGGGGEYVGRVITATRRDEGGDGRVLRDAEYGVGVGVEVREGVVLQGDFFIGGVGGGVVFVRVHTHIFIVWDLFGGFVSVEERVFVFVEGLGRRWVRGCHGLTFEMDKRYYREQPDLREEGRR